jgi:hypothetical protein
MSSRMLSPKEVYNNPLLWLDVTHDTHEAYSELMVLLYPDWIERLGRIRCYYCAGLNIRQAINRETGETLLIDGDVTDEQGHVLYYHTRHEPTKG